MHYQKLGSSDLEVSKVSLGAMSLKDEEGMERIVHRAIELGINFFDTSDLYDKGQNERNLGKALKQDRNRVMIATKVGNQWRPDGSGWDWNPRKEYILAAAEESLRRLGTEYVDLYQLHGGTIQDPIDETIDAFETLVQKGKIRYYGISSIRPNVIRQWVQRSNIVSVMMQYSLLDRRPEEEALPLLLQKGIGVLARGGIAQGLLVNKPPKPYLNYTEDEVRQAAATIQQLSSKERSAAQTALSFIWGHLALTSAVVGIRTGEQLEEAVKAGEASSLTPGEIGQLKNAVPVNYYGEHR